MDKETNAVFLSLSLQANDNLKRIADALETIIKMVKQDQDAVAAYRKKQDEQKTWASNGPRLPAALAMAFGSGSKLQAPGRKLQATGCKLDTGKL